MKTILKLSLILGLTTLVGCTTPGRVDMPVVQQYGNPQLEQKVVSYEITYQAPEHGLFVDGEMLPTMDISKARLSFASRKVFNEFNRILASQLPSNALVSNNKSEDFTLKAKFIAKDSDGPVYVEDQLGETLLKNTLSLGLTADEQLVVAEFQVTYTLLDSNNKTLFSQTYQVNDSVEHESSDLEYTNETGNLLGGQLLEKSIILTLNEFMKELSTKA